jgi:hypothetical protein
MGWAVPSTVCTVDSCPHRWPQADLLRVKGDTEGQLVMAESLVAGGRTQSCLTSVQRKSDAPLSLSTLPHSSAYSCAPENVVIEK